RPGRRRPRPGRPADAPLGRSYFFFVAAAGLAGAAGAAFLPFAGAGPATAILASCRASRDLRLAALFRWRTPLAAARSSARSASPATAARSVRSEEHTSELQSLAYLVCRLLLEKKKT